MQNYPLYFPLGSTIQRIPDTNSLKPSSSPFFQHYGIITGNPKDGSLVMFYRHGNDDMQTSGLIGLRTSLNGGETWGPELLINPGSLWDLRYLAGGFDSNGDLYIYYATFDWNNQVFHNISYVQVAFVPMTGLPYTINAGSTFLGPFSGFFPPGTINWDQQNCFFAPYGHILDLGIKGLWQTGYFYDDNTQLYHLFIADTNSNFTIREIYPSVTVTERYINPSMVDLGGGYLLILAQDLDNPYQFKQFISSDYGLTWNPDPNLTQFDSGTPSDPNSPPFLSYINFNGIGLVVCYYTRLSSTGFYEVRRVFALAKELINNGVSAWNIGPIKTCEGDYSQTAHSGYPSFYHPLNQFQGIGLNFYVDYDTSSPPNQISWPAIIFTEDDGIISELQTII
jgi:hypothetical protein